MIQRSFRRVGDRPAAHFAEPPSEWQALKFVQTLLEATLRRRMVKMVDVARNLTRNFEFGRRLIEVSKMTRLEIKARSYDGALVSRSGWHYANPGNRCYAIFWHILRHESNAHNRTSEQDRVLKVIKAFEERWPSVEVSDSAKAKERIGDVIEAVLADFYYETGPKNALWVEMSDLGFLIKDTMTYLKDHRENVDRMIKSTKVAEAFVFAGEWHKTEVHMIKKECWKDLMRCADETGRPQWLINKLTREHQMQVLAAQHKLYRAVEP